MLRAPLPCPEPVSCRQGGLHLVCLSQWTCAGAIWVALTLAQLPADCGRQRGDTNATGVHRIACWFCIIHAHPW